MDKLPSKKLLIAFVGMPGSGKSEATTYLEKKGFPRVRFGEVTDKGLAAQGLPITPENEKHFRENLRREIGMDAYAVKSQDKINTALSQSSRVVIDGLYSWEEYLFLKKYHPNLVVIHIDATPEKRYQRLSARSVRPFSLEDARERDRQELDHLNKRGPIENADYVLNNNTDSLEDLHKKIDELLVKLT